MGKIRIIFELMRASVIFFLTLLIHGSLHAQTLLAGASTISITPVTAVPMSGYADREQPSKGVHDELFARAFVFDDGKTKACLIQADLIGFSFQFADKLFLEIETRTGIPSSNCMLVAVHNHSGPSTGVYGEATTENLKAYLSDLREKLATAAADAFTKRVPAYLGVRKGKCTMNINRRAKMGDGNIWLGRNPDGPCDHDVAVVRINNANNEPIGMIVNWPCHATVGGQENSLISADWPGATATYVKKHFKNTTIGITAGASADINPIYGPNNSFEDMDAIGLLLGEEVVKNAENAAVQPAGTITVARREVNVPGKEPGASRKAGEKIVKGPPVKIRFSILKIGSVVFAGISGELMTSIGMKIKDESPYSDTILLTHCNGSSGYLCTDAAYQEGGYEPMVSRTAPGVEKIIEDTIMGMLKAL